MESYTLGINVRRLLIGDMLVTRDNWRWERGKRVDRFYSVTFTGVESHSFGVILRDHFILEWKSTLEIVESNLKIAIKSRLLQWIQLHDEIILIPLQKEH